MARGRIQRSGMGARFAVMCPVTALNCMAAPIGNSIQSNLLRSGEGGRVSPEKTLECGLEPVLIARMVERSAKTANPQHQALRCMCSVRSGSIKLGYRINADNEAT